MAVAAVVPALMAALPMTAAAAALTSAVLVAVVVVAMAVGCASVWGCNSGSFGGRQFMQSRC